MPLLFYYVSCIFRCASHCKLILIKIIASHCIDLHAALVLHKNAVMSAACDRKVMRQTSRSLHITRIVQSIHDADPKCIPTRCCHCCHMDGLSLSHPELVAHHTCARRHIPVKRYCFVRTQQWADHLKFRIRILQGIVRAVHHA